MICFDKITEIYSIVDEFCQNFEQQTSSFLLGNKPKRPPKMSTSEVITIVLLFHLSGLRTFKHFYIFYVQKHTLKYTCFLNSKYCLGVLKKV